jgi:hypothetical protein
VSLEEGSQVIFSDLSRSEVTSSERLAMKSLGGWSSAGGSSFLGLRSLLS